MRLSWMVGLGMLVGCPQPTDDTDPTDETDTTPTGKTDTTPTSPTGDSGNTDTDTGTPPPPGSLVGSCDDLAKETPLAPGRYEGDTSDQTGDVSVSGCLAGAPGGDLVGLVRVQPGELLSATLVHGHGAVYLLEDCADAGSCVDGAAGGPVSALHYFHEGKAARDLVLVVDGTVAGGEPWALDLDITTTTVSSFYDNCAEAAYELSEMPGEYVVSMAGATESSDPGAGTCGLQQAQGGADRMFPFDVLPGRVLTVDAPVVSYVMTDCEDPAGTCQTSTRGGLTSWHNPGPLAEQVFVALETPGAGASDVFEMSLTMTAPTLVDVPDTCSEAESAGPIALGPRTISLQGLGHEGLNANQCSPAAAPGVRPDAVFPVLVGAGAEAALEFEEPVVAYWVDDCNVASSCLQGGMPTTRLAFYNGDVDSRLVYAVVEPIEPTPAVITMTLRNRILTADPAPDSCGDVITSITKSGPVIVPLSAATDDFDLSTSFCGSAEALDGGDRVFAVTVPVGERVVAQVTRGDEAVALTVLEDCVDALTCDETAVGGQAVDYFNTGAVPALIHLVVDHPRAVAPGAVTVDVQFDSPSALAAADTCDDSSGLSDLGAGTYMDRVTDLSNQIELDGATCLDIPTPGPDGLVPVSLAPGQRLDATVTGVSDHLYVLSDCEDQATCEQGSFALDGPMSWVNDTTSAQSGTLVVDGVVPILGGDGEIEVNVDIVPSVALPGGDTCVEAQSTFSVSSGSYHGTTVGLTNELEAATCLSGAASGTDLIVPMELLPNTLAEVRAWGTGMQLYFVDDCADDLTCGDAATPSDDPGVVSAQWHNGSAKTALRYLVVDRSTGTFDFVVEIEERAVTPTVLPDSCTTASSATDLTTGTHLLGGTLVGLTDDLDAAAGVEPSCTGTVSWGTEGMVPIELAGGETVRAELQVEGAEASLYLVQSCTDPDSCVVGSDQPGADVITYTNEGVGPERHFLVIDTLVGSGSFLAEVVIE